MTRKLAVTREQKRIADELCELGTDGLSVVLNGIFIEGVDSPEDFITKMLGAFQPFIREGYATLCVGAKIEETENMIGLDAAFNTIIWNDDCQRFDDRDTKCVALVTLTDKAYDTIFPGYL